MARTLSTHQVPVGIPNTPLVHTFLSLSQWMLGAHLVSFERNGEGLLFMHTVRPTCTHTSVLL